MNLAWSYLEEEENLFRANRRKRNNVPRENKASIGNGGVLGVPTPPPVFRMAVVGWHGDGPIPETPLGLPGDPAFPSFPPLRPQMAHHHRGWSQRGGAVQGLWAGQAPAHSHRRQDLQGPRDHGSVCVRPRTHSHRGWALGLTGRVGALGEGTCLGDDVSGEAPAFCCRSDVPGLGTGEQQTQWSVWLTQDSNPSQAVPHSPSLAATHGASFVAPAVCPDLKG